MSNCMLVYQSASFQSSQMKPEPITLVTGVTKINNKFYCCQGALTGRSIKGKSL